jgi:hypothetical protein
MKSLGAVVGVVVIAALAGSGCVVLPEAYPGPAPSLPEECTHRNPELLVPIDHYRHRGYDEGSCRFAAVSHDSQALAHVHLETREMPTFEMSRSIDAVKLVTENHTHPVELYRSQLWHVLDLRWLADGRLLIFDATMDLDEHPGITLVYNPRAGGIEQRLPYPLDDRVTAWNPQGTAFYTAYVVRLGSVCTAYMGGYDFENNRELPSFSSLIAPEVYGPNPSWESLRNPESYVAVSSPVWSNDGTQVLVSLSGGELTDSDPNTRVRLDGFSIAVLDIKDAELGPTIMHQYDDSNYFLQSLEDGGYEIISEPHEIQYLGCPRA